MSRAPASTRSWGRVTRRPLPVLAVTARARAGGRGAGAAARAERGHRHAGRPRLGHLKDTERFKKDFGDEAVVVLVRGDLQNTMLTSDLGRLIRLEGCLSRQRAGQQAGAGSLPPVVPRASRSSKPGEGRVRAGHVHQHRGQPDQRRARQAGRPGAGTGASRRPRRRGGCRSGAATPPAEQERLAAGGRAGRAAPKFISDVARARRSATGISGVPRIDDPSFVSALVFDRNAGAGSAEVALRVPVPVEERRADRRSGCGPT